MNKTYRPKAYAAWVDDSDKGCSVVFAQNARDAKKNAYSWAESCEDEKYIDIRVKRIPEADKHFDGNIIGDWYNMELRETLVKEYGWFCIEPNKEECEVCKLCEVVE